MLLSLALALTAWSAPPLVEAYAPLLYQETGRHWRYDIPLAVNFDGDWDPENNWENAKEAELVPTLYYKEVRGVERTFLFYFAFYPRDHSWFCVPILCHENDLEGMVLELDGGGNPLRIEAQFHNSFLSQDWKEGRPELRAEWGGHGWRPGKGEGLALRPGRPQTMGEVRPQDAVYRLLPFADVEAQVEALGIDWQEMKTPEGRKRLPRAIGGGFLNFTSARFPWSWDYGPWKEGRWYFRDLR